MTIVETERVSAPPKEREDAREERERRASVLEAAALEIEVRGWIREDYCNAGGAVCLMGAAKAALGWVNLSDYAGDDEVDLIWGDVPAVERELHKVDIASLASWNDDHARDADDVTFLLRWRAEEIRDGR